MLIVEDFVLLCLTLFSWCQPHNHDFLCYWVITSCKHMTMLFEVNSQNPNFNFLLTIAILLIRRKGYENEWRDHHKKKCFNLLKKFPLNQFFKDVYGEEGGLKGQGNSLLMFYTFRRRDCLHKFMVVLCERGETRSLIEYPFINLQDEVLDT